MGDHLFEAPVLTRLLSTPTAEHESLLAIDTRRTTPVVVAEATKVRMKGRRIVAIGKQLPVYDAIDTGIFVCTPALFPALQTSRLEGDATLSGGIRHLAARGWMRGVDIGDAVWHDIDTMSDLEAAEGLIAEHA
jgi:1L-myo-inositol 1-phosphate cytidylyltransferase